MDKVRAWLLGWLTYERAETLRNLICWCLLYSGVAWLISRTRPRSATVLVYHSIGGKNIFSDNVLPTNVFERQMRFLTKHYKPVKLEQIIAALKEGKTPDPSWVAVTFDDGYKDFVTQAVPILKRYNIPASIYVPTGVLDGAPLFIDEIEKMVTQARIPTLRLSTPRKDIFLKLNSTDQRRDASLRIALELREMNPADRAAALNGLRTQCGLATLEPTDDYLHAEDLAAYLDHVSVGSHSINHYSLAHLDDATLERELAESRKRLNQILGREVAVLAYPFGKRWSFDDRVKQAAAKLGYEAALTTIPGQIRAGIDLMAIPRVGVGRSLARLQLVLFGILI